MPKYRKKPVVIKAIKWNGDRHKVMKFCEELIAKSPDESKIAFSKDGPVEDRKVYIKTLEGTMAVDYGDYIIKGVEGEFYPCKPEIFHKTYEKVSR